MMQQSASEKWSILLKITGVVVEKSPLYSSSPWREVAGRFVSLRANGYYGFDLKSDR
jgi:hypothetical protein